MRPSEAKKVSTRIIWSETKKLKLKVSSASQPHVLIRIGSQSPPDTKQSIPPFCGLQKMLLVPFRFDSEVLVLVSCEQFFSSLLSAVLSMKSTGIEIYSQSRFRRWKENFIRRKSGLQTLIEPVIRVEICNCLTGDAVRI